MSKAEFLAGVEEDPLAHAREIPGLRKHPVCLTAEDDPPYAAGSGPETRRASGSGARISEHQQS